MKKRIISAILLVFVAVVALIPTLGFNAEAAETSAITLDFTKSANNTSISDNQQVWTENGITLTNNKGSSSTKVNNYTPSSSGHARFYKDSEIIIAYPGMTKIVFTCTGSSYAKSPTGLTGASASTSGTTLTITLNNPTDSFTFQNNGSQLRVTKITVYAQSCQHTNKTTTDTATCTKAGTVTVKCNDCGITISTATSAAKGHTPGAEATCDTAQTCTVCNAVLAPATEKHDFVDGACSVCGLADPSACAHTNNTTVDTATCTKDGEKTTTCDDCDEVQSVVASPAKGHTPGAAADCTNAQTCTVCGDVITEALGHDHDENGTCHCGDQLPLATFVVNGETVDSIYANNVSLPVAPQLPDMNYSEDYTFVGWAKAEQDGTTVKPTIYNANSITLIDEDTTFYAVYSYTATTLTTVSGYIKTNLSDIKSTDVVVITMAKGSTVYALTSSNGTSKAPAAVTVTVNGDALSGAIADNMLWNITNNNNSLTIYVNGKTTYLYCTSSNDGVRVGTNTNKEFTIDASSGYLKHTSTGRYVGVYTTNPDWRCYTNTTGNTAGQTLAFYVATNKEVATEVSYYTTALEVSECEHDYEYEETQAPTCTDAGMATYTCSNCGDSYTEAIPAIGHNYTDYISNNDATCTKDGTKTAHCENDCGSQVTVADESSALGHNYVDFICTECGAFDLENIDFSGRYYIATIRSEGNYWYMTSEVASSRYTAVDSGLTTLPESIVGGDAKNIFVLVKNDDGTYSIYAEGINENAKYLGWNKDNTGILVEASNALKLTVSLNDDNTLSFHFAASDGERYLSLNGNSGNNYFAFYKGTQKQNLTLIPVEHKYEAVVTAPTCTEAGYTTYTCACGDKYVADEVDAFGHNYEAVVTAPTCTEAGFTTYTCSNCDDSYDVAGDPANGHSYEAEVTAPTCTEAGYTTYTCSVCYYAYVADVVPATSHDYEAVVTAPTCTEAGYTTYTCSNCGDSFVADEVKALEHNYEIVVTAPTCTEDGYTTYVCSVCDDTYRIVIPTTGHNFVDYICTECGILDVNYIGFTGASLNVGSDLSIRYHALLGENAADYTVRFTMNGKVTEVKGVLENGKYVFSFCGITPQCMGDSVKAELILNGEVVDTVEEFSVKSYVVKAFEIHADNAILLQFLSDMLYYGAEAQIYVNYKTDALVTDGIELYEASNNAPAEDYDHKSIVTEDGYDKTLAKFTAAGVNFDYNNRIFVKLTGSDLANAELYVNGALIEIEEIGEGKYIAYSYAISALEFEDEFEFELYYDGELAQTLTYTVADYVVAMQGDVEISSLVNALYNYGMSAKEYDANK